MRSSRDHRPPCRVWPSSGVAVHGFSRVWKAAEPLEPGCRRVYRASGNLACVDGRGTAKDEPCCGSARTVGG